MRHRMKGRMLNRTSSHRKAMFSNMVASLIEHEQIKTTLPKAKDLRTFADKMITLAKKNTLASRRQAFAFLRNEAAVKKLFDTLGKRYEKRDGGYCRVLKAGFRSGDVAPMAVIEYMDRDVNAKGLKQRQLLEAQKAGEVKQTHDEIKADDKVKKVETKKVAAPKKDVKSVKGTKASAGKVGSVRKTVGASGK